MPARFLTAKDAAKYLGLGLRTFRRHVQAGRIKPWVDPDTGWRRFSTFVLDQFAETNGGQAA